MFSQRKSFWRKRWFVFVIIGLIGFGYWINQSAFNPIQPEDSNKETGINTPVDQNTPETGEGEPVQTITNNPDDQETEKSKPFYLIKELDQVISIYYYDEKGEENFVRHTDIAFSLLSEADQALFSEGIIKYTEEELEELLQDFGS